MTREDHGAISRLMESYFDGLYHADSTILRGVFHPHLAYVCATEGDELYLDLETYMARVDKREPPARRGNRETKPYWKSHSAVIALPGSRHG